MGEERLRLISPEPELALILEGLRRRKLTQPPLAELPKVISDGAWRWLVDWIADVGIVMRSRETAIYTLAMGMMTGLITLPFAVVPELKERLPLISRSVGVR